MRKIVNNDCAMTAFKFRQFGTDTKAVHSIKLVGEADWSSLDDIWARMKCYRDICRFVG